MAADNPEEVEARRLHAVARRSAKDTLVTFDCAANFKNIVRSGKLFEEMDAAFKFVQEKLDGILGCILA